MPISPRRVTRADEMRALAHPLRLRLLELLSAEGSFTASVAARRLSESPSNVSWHLRKLAEYGFVRQGPGPGRERPWKFVGQSLALGDDAEDDAAATALTDVMFEREFQVLRGSLRAQSLEPEVWRDATVVLQSRLWLTPDEARAFSARLSALFVDEELIARNADPERRPAEARLTAAMSWLVPASPPSAGDLEPGGAGASS